MAYELDLRAANHERNHYNRDVDMLKGSESINWPIRIFLKGILREAEILEEVENGIRRYIMIQMGRIT